MRQLRTVFIPELKQQHVAEVAQKSASTPRRGEQQERLSPPFVRGASMKVPGHPKRRWHGRLAALPRDLRVSHFTASPEGLEQSSAPDLTTSFM